MKTDLPYIYIKGILVGNGVMNFENNALDKTEIQYMIDHQLISTRMELIYLRACSRDFDSPRCKFFRYEFDIYLAYINQYSNFQNYLDIYETCADIPTEAIRLKEALSAKKSVRKDGLITQQEDTILGEIPDCPSDTGMIQYWNLNKYAYNVNSINKTW